MTLDEAITQFSTLLGFRTDMVSKAPAMLTNAQAQYERGPVYPWFLLSEDSTILTELGDRRVPVPGDYIAEYEEGALFYDAQDGSDEEPLYKYDNDYLMKKVGSKTTGTPKWYSQDGKYFNIFPLPSAARYQLVMKYYKHDTVISSLSGSATNLWLTNAPECLIGLAGARLATGLRDNVALAQFQKMESDARAQLNIQNEEKKHSNRIYQIGGEV